MKVLFFSTLIVLAIVFDAHAGEEDVVLELEGRYWFTDLKASTRFDDEVRGTDINLERDLDLREENFPEGRLTWYTGPKSSVFFDATWAKWEGEETLSQTVDIRDRTFDIGARVASALDLQLYRIGWVWQFIDASDGLIRLGTLFDIRVVVADFSIEGELNNVSQRAEENLTVPLASLGFALDIHPFKGTNLFFRGSGIPNTPYGYFISGEAGIKIIPFKNFSIVGGYRYEDFNAHNTNDTTQVKLRLIGPFAGLSLRF